MVRLLLSPGEATLAASPSLISDGQLVCVLPSCPSHGAVVLTDYSLMRESDLVYAITVCMTDFSCVRFAVCAVSILFCARCT